MKKTTITAILCLFSAFNSTGQTLAVDSTLERYYAIINDTTIDQSRPPATRLYCYTTTDLLYSICTVSWQLCYVQDGTTYTLATGQVQMNGNYYAEYVADDRKIVHLFKYAANQIGVTIK